MSERRRRGWLSEDEFKKALEDFASETVRLLRLKVLEILPVLTPMLVEAWPLILSEQVYEADALQIRTSIYSGSNALLTGDKDLINAALRVGLKAVNVEDEDEVKELFK
ncbi:MAG: type II toxin-antitoxin system VapC family toxin [Candidatus Bathyarchaeia archaeon]